MSPTPLLEMTGVSKHFGATHALRNVSLTVHPGEVMALVGENGAGKSTLMKILSGAVRADTGVMRVAGKTYAPHGPHDALKTGVAMIYQELNLAPDLSIEDNIMLGQEVHRWGAINRAAQRERVRRALAQLGRDGLRPETPVRELPIATRQLVEIARALALSAKIFVFDEPTSSLSRQDVEHLFEVIARLRRSGLAVVYISHFLEELRQVCDSYTVLRDGEQVGAGSFDSDCESKLVSLMVGRTVNELFPTIPHEIGKPILEVTGLTGLHMPRDVSLTLRRGEVLGIAGLVGAGRTELLRTIFALDPVRNGRIRIADNVSAPSPRARLSAGLGYVSEDRKTEGLAQSRSIADNITYSRLKPYSNFGWLDLARRQSAVATQMRKMQIKAHSSEQEVQHLSGGNQQKVSIARVLHQDADVLLLDEPTRGIDVGTKSEIYRIIGQEAARGKGVLFVSSYLPELLAVCDTIAVMTRGKLRELRPAHKWNEEQLLAAAIAGAEGQ
jgi:ribose transport system ATP-binding protein